MKDKQGENENSNRIHNPPTMKYERYQKFRLESYPMLGKIEAAALELMNNIMTTKNFSCLAKFSLSPQCQKKNGRVFIKRYKIVAQTEIN